MIAAPFHNTKMTASPQESEEPTDTKPEPSARRTSRRTRNTALSSSLNLGSSMTSSRRAQDANLKSSFSSSIDRRAGLAATKGRLSQSFIDQSGEGLDDDTINEILKGFSDDKEDDDARRVEKEESQDGMSEMKAVQRKDSGGRRCMLASIESQKSMHFNVRDESGSDDD
ncbi:hypothetical protein ACHAXN_001424 [Cyclotella atomus]